MNKSIFRDQTFIVHFVDHIIHFNILRELYLHTKTIQCGIIFNKFQQTALFQWYFILLFNDVCIIHVFWHGAVTYGPKVVGVNMCIEEACQITNVAQGCTHPYYLDITYENKFVLNIALFCNCVLRSYFCIILPWHTCTPLLINVAIRIPYILFICVSFASDISRVAPLLPPSPNMCNCGKKEYLITI